MQLFVLYVPERLAADVASMLRLVVDENMFRNVRPLAAPTVQPFTNSVKNTSLNGTSACYRNTHTTV